MTPWMLATIALLPPLAVPLILACRGALANRLIAVQLAAAVTVQILVLMTFAFDQSAFVDLPLTLALLALPGTLAMALFLERWL
ncbi:MAG: monovalent cation/H+ antiporter complex subunit F [Acidiphilium sp.]